MSGLGTASSVTPQPAKGPAHGIDVSRPSPARWTKSDEAAAMIAARPARSLPGARRNALGSGTGGHGEMKRIDRLPRHGRSARSPGGGKVRTTWPGGRCGATSVNQAGSVTARVVSGMLLATAVAMGTTATAATARATPPAAAPDPCAPARPWPCRADRLVPRPLDPGPTEPWVRSTTIASTTATHSEVKAAKRLGHDVLDQRDIGSAGARGSSSSGHAEGQDDGDDPERAEEPQSAIATPDDNAGHDDDDHPETEVLGLGSAGP